MYEHIERGFMCVVMWLHFGHAQADYPEIVLSTGWTGFTSWDDLEIHSV